MVMKKITSNVEDHPNNRNWEVFTDDDVHKVMTICHLVSLKSSPQLKNG